MDGVVALAVLEVGDAASRQPGSGERVDHSIEEAR